MVLEPIADLLAHAVIPHDIGSAELSEMTAHGLHRAAGEPSKVTRSRRPAVIQEDNELVNDWTAEQAAEARFAIFNFVHRSPVR
jgi:hypothetical protein